MRPRRSGCGDRPASRSGPPTAGSAHADVLIVGAGIAGLATAYHLAARAPDLRVVVAEATHVGFGATARSTGIVGPGLSAPLRTLRRRHGDAVTTEAFASTLRGVAGTRRLIDVGGDRLRRPASRTTWSAR